MDPITVNIDANFAPLGPDELAGATPFNFPQAYDLIAGAVSFDGQNEADDQITQSIPTFMNVSFNLPPGFTLTGGINATKANLKALGFNNLDANLGPSDGLIEFGSGVMYDFDNSDGVTPGFFDFETIAAHEIGHILGFSSAVDDVDAVLNAGATAAISPTPFDLYRFQDGSINDPATAADFTTATRSLVPGSDDVFDQVLAGPGLTELALSTGVFNGDGRQASHFEDSLDLGLLDPTFAPGDIVLVGTNDVRVLDLIGYEVGPVAVPEPSAISLMMLLAGSVIMRRRRA